MPRSIREQVLGVASGRTVEGVRTTSVDSTYALTLVFDDGTELVIQSQTRDPLEIRASRVEWDVIATAKPSGGADAAGSH